MALQLDLKLTTDGRNALWNSKSRGVNLDLTHIQFGSRNRVTTGEENSLVQPKQYSAIGNGSRIAQDQIRIMTTMIGGENYNVAEIGLWSGVPNVVGSILVAYVSVATGFIAQMVSGIDLVFAYDMVLSTEDLDSINIIMDSDQSSTLSLLEAHENDRNAHPFYVTLDTAQTIQSAKTFTNMVTFSGGLTGNVTGNVSGSASKLATARSIALSGGVTGTATNFDGSGNIVIPVTSVDATKLNGTASINTTGNAGTATKLAAAVSLAITGAVTGAAVRFDGTGNVTINTTVLDASKITVGTIPAARIPTLNQDTTGNAATATLAAAATKLTTARKINNALFDGTADATISNLPTEVTIGTGQGESYQIIKLGNYNKVVGGGLGQYIQTGKWLTEPTRQLGMSLMNDSGSQVSALILGTTNAYHQLGSATPIALARVTDNVASATKLENARLINGVSFDGTGNITVPVAMTDIASNTNLNTVTSAGFYRCPTNAIAATLSNSPTTSAFSLFVEWSAGWVQTLTEYPTTGTPKTYKRHGYSGVWGAWYEILTTLNPDTTKLPLSGGTLTGVTTFNATPIFKNGIGSTVPVSFLDSGSAQAINTGGVLVSNSYADASLVPTNGIYSKGDIKTATWMYAARFVGLLSGNVQTNASAIATDISGLGGGATAPILIPDLSVGSSVGYVPFIHGSTTSNSGYRQQGSFGLYRGSLTWSDNAFYMAQGGNDNYPTEAYLFKYGRTISHTGGAINLVGNADTATKLANARTINGVSFDGSANITVADATKLPLAGGTMTGALTVPTVITVADNGTNFQKLIQCATVTDGGYVAVGNTAADRGYVELGTVDDGDTKIYVRKRNSSNAVLATQVLMDESNNASFVANMSVAGTVTAAKFEGPATETAIESVSDAIVVKAVWIGATLDGHRVDVTFSTATTVSFAMDISGKNLLKMHVKAGTVFHLKQYGTNNPTSDATVTSVSFSGTIMTVTASWTHGKTVGSVVNHDLMAATYKAIRCSYLGVGNTINNGTVNGTAFSHVLQLSAAPTMPLINAVAASNTYMAGGNAGDWLMHDAQPTAISAGMCKSNLLNFITCDSDNPSAQASPYVSITLSDIV